VIQTEQRIDRLERLVADLDARMGLLERPVPKRMAQPANPHPVTADHGAARSAPAPPVRVVPAPQRPPTVRLDFGRDDLEDLVGGRVLAWVGGLAVLVGIVFLFALAISNGWIGETARVAIGAAGSAGLLALGVWLHERKARTDAALASVATGISGLFITITVAAQVYELVPQLMAVVFAVGVGAVATALALRWESRGVAALGILGALAAPVLTGVAGDGGTMVILFVALASAAGVLLWQRWDWLALAAFAVATPQWIAYVVDGPPALEQLAVLIGFGALGVAVAVGHDVRVLAERLRSSSAYLLVLSAIVVSGVGWGALSEAAGEGAGNAWLAGMALVHLSVGLGGRTLRLSNDLRLLALVIGAVLADVAFGLIAGGPALAIGWGATGVGFAALVRRGPGQAGPDAGVLAQAGLGGHLALSLLSAIAVSNPVQVLDGYEPLSAAGAAAVAALAAGCLVSARIAGEKHEHWGTALDAVGLIAVAVLTAMSLDGLQLVLAWTAEAVALAAIARRTYDEVAALGALGFLALTAIHAIAFEAPPVSLVTGLAAPAAAVAALAAVAGCLVLLAALAESEPPELRTALRVLAALTLLYLASTGVVTPFESDSAVDSALLSAHQQGQMVLSVFWGLVGVGTVVVGLRRDLGVVRIAGLALLGVAVTKVFLFDLATLTSVYRVVSFIGLGLLLLGGALVWQRLRPQALSDLRETPAGVR
jgi:uncharacterized membrane protein